MHWFYSKKGLSAKGISSHGDCGFTSQGLCGVEQGSESAGFLAIGSWLRGKVAVMVMGGLGRVEGWAKRLRGKGWG